MVKAERENALNRANNEKAIELLRQNVQSLGESLGGVKQIMETHIKGIESESGKWESVSKKVKYQHDGVLNKLRQLLDDQKQQYERLSFKSSTKEYRLTDIPQLVQVTTGLKPFSQSNPEAFQVNKFPSMENLSPNQENFEISGFFCNQKPK